MRLPKLRKFDERRRRASRQAALDRPELRTASTTRVAPSGPVSMAIKVIDPAIRRLIERYKRGEPGHDSV